jgi:hypothetical protein
MQYIPRGPSATRDLEWWPNATKDLDRLMETRGGYLDIGISGVWCPVSGFRYFVENEVFFPVLGQATK